MPLDPQIRPLSDKERRYLKNQRAALVRRWASFGRRSIFGTGVVCGGLAALTFLAERDHPWLVLGFWAGVGAVIAVWSWVQERRPTARRIRGYDHVLATGTCSDVAIKAKRMWEFEEQEDEGACYAFERESGGVVFVVGQDFYPGPRFPNSDFSLIEFHDSTGGLIDRVIEKRGDKIVPERIISGAEQKGLSVPEHGTCFEGSLEDAVARLKVA